MEPDKNGFRIIFMRLIESMEKKKGNHGWLVLNRKEGERILIGADVEIRISKIKDRSVVIAIKANPQIKIVRVENSENKEEG